MRVGLKNGGVTVWLAGNPALSEREHSSVSDFRVNGEIVTQENRFLRAAAASFVDRLNLATTISFGTSRLFASADEAEAWALDYDATAARTGTLVMVSQMAGGGLKYRYMAGAVIRPPEREVTGCTVRLRYTAQGGKILTTL